MNFQTSTHKRDWLFDAETLRQKYVQAQQQAVQTLTSLKGSDGVGVEGSSANSSNVISLDDEVLLKLYYQVKLKDICTQQQLPSKVLNAALVFFKRFYTQASCLEHDPLRVMPTCIYLACKVEESYRSAEGLCKLLGVDQGLVLRFEVPLLQGLQFDLVVHSPYRALAGLFKEFDQLRAQQSSTALDPGLLSAPPEALSAAHTKARAAADLLMLTDAPLLYPPGALAVAALRSGFRAVNLSCQQYLKHIAHKAAAVTAAGGTAAAAASAVVGGGGDAAAADQQQQQQQQQEQRLLGTLAAIDQLAAEQVHVDGDALRGKATEIDRRVKMWRKGLAGGGGGGGSGGGGGKAAGRATTPPAAAAAAVGAVQAV